MDDWIEVENLDNVLFKDVTLSAWVLWTAPTHMQHAFLSNYNHYGQHLGLRMNESGKAVFFYDRDFSEYDFISLKSISKIDDGEWHHIIAVLRSGIKAEIYVDGKLENCTDEKVPELLKGESTFYLGRDGYGEANGISRWNGKIDEVRIFKRALTKNEVKELFLQKIYCRKSIACLLFF